MKEDKSMPLFHQFCVACLTVFLAAEPATAQAKKEPQAIPKTRPTKELLDTLLKSHQAYELPVPPADATLVRTTTGTRSYSYGKYIDFYGLGFLVKSKKAGDPDRVYWPHGRIDVVSRLQVVKVVEPRPDAIKDDDSNLDTELAILCHARGWTEMAFKALEQNHSAKNVSPETDLAQSAWRHWLREFQNPETDRKKVARLLKTIWENRKNDFTPYDRRILDSLELSLAPGRGKPDTLEGMIDDLIDVNHTDRTNKFSSGKVAHPAYSKLARRGFEAVPALIEHLADERLTRAYKQGLNNFRGYQYTVGDMVCDLLQGLAGDDLGKDWVRRQQGYRLDKEAVERWWADAQKVGEETYLVRHVLGEKKGLGLKNRLMLDVLAHKYPKQLPGLYRRMLKERSEMYGWELGDAAEESSLPKETKRELWLEATRHKGTEIRVDGISRLLRLDRPDGVKILLEELDRVPVTPEGEYWSCPESRLASIAIHANEPAAWKALEKTAQRVDVGLRMEFLAHLARSDQPETVQKTGLGLLAKFLEDSTVRDVRSSTKYGGLPAGRSEFPKIEVRNFVADQIASHFKMDAEPKPEWTEAEWAKLRADVKKILAREGIR